MKYHNENIIIPIHILKNISENEKFKELFINSLKRYTIDEETIFQSSKNIKFLLLEEMIEIKCFLFEYKDNTNNIIKELIDKSYKKEIENKKLIIVYKNYDENNNYYDKVKSLINEEHLNKIKAIKEDLDSVNKKINNLEQISCYLKNFFPKNNEKIEEVNNKIKGLEEGNIINDTDYSSYLNEIGMEDQDKLLDLNFLKSIYFKKIYSKNKENFQEEEDLLEKSKSDFSKLKQIFSDEKIEIKMNNDDIKKFLQTIKKDNNLKQELKNINEIINEHPIPEERINDLIEEIETYDTLYQIKIILSGIINLMEILGVVKKGLYKKIKEYFDNINNKKNIITLEKIKEIIQFLEEIKININTYEENYMNFFELLDKNPNAINWILDKRDEDFNLLRKFILDSDKNEHLTFEILKSKEIKKIFKDLENKTDEEFINKILDILIDKNQSQ